MATNKKQRKKGLSSESRKVLSRAEPRNHCSWEGQIPSSALQLPQCSPEDAKADGSSTRTASMAEGGVCPLAPGQDRVHLDRGPQTPLWTLAKPATQHSALENQRKALQTLTRAPQPTTFLQGTPGEKP